MRPLVISSCTKTRPALPAIRLRAAISAVATRAAAAQPQLSRAVGGRSRHAIVNRSVRSTGFVIHSGDYRPSKEALERPPLGPEGAAARAGMERVEHSHAVIAYDRRPATHRARVG